MKLDTKNYYDFNQVMLIPKLARKGLTSRDDVMLTRRFAAIPESNRPYEWEGVPIIAANMDTVGTFDMANVLTEYNCCVALHKHYTVHELVNYFILNEHKEHLLFYTMGINEDSMQKLHSFIATFKAPKNICIDAANGYTEKFLNCIRTVRAFLPDALIMAGNVVTGDATYAAINAGASIVKVGIGSGSACLTRRVTGVGMPQFSAILECADAAHGLNALICSDGGCVEYGDVSKAFGGGADFVMLGGMLAGHDECGGNIIQKDNGKFMEFYGMSSSMAMGKHNGGMASYKASEGRNLLIPYKGSVKNTLLEIFGGVRSTMTYIGAKELKEISKCSHFIVHGQQLNTSFAKYEKGE